MKRQAVAELQRAVAAAESKACELVATERAKMEKLLLEARKQAAEEALAAVVVANQQQQQAESSEVVSALPAPSQQNVSSIVFVVVVVVNSRVQQINPVIVIYNSYNLQIVQV